MSDDTFQVDDENTGNGSQPREERASRREERRDERRDERSRDRDEDRPQFTLADMGRINARPTVGGVSDAALSVLVDAFDNAKSFDKPGVPAETKRSRFKVIPLDSYTAKSALSSLLVVLPTQIGGLPFALTYILMIEQPGEPSTRTLSERGEQFDALVLPEDHLTDKYMKVVREQVGASAEGKVIIAGSQIILAETISMLGEKEGSTRIAAIFDNALDAICGTRENIIDAQSGHRDNSQRINPNMVARGDRLELTNDYSGKQCQDSSGLLVRSDLTSTLYYSTNTRDEEEDLYARTPMGEIRAGLDLFMSYDESVDSRPRFGGRGRGGRRDRDVVEPFWQAVLNINSITSAPNFPFSLELAQLLIAQIGLQSNDYRWATLLRPRTTIGGDLKPLVNLGHLFLMHPDEEKACVVDDISPNSSDVDLGDFLEETVKPDVAFGLTIPSSGEKSWALSIFERIAITKDSRERAGLIKILIESADVLTGGRFSRIYDDLNPNGNSPVYQTGTRSFLGTWVQDGKVRDLREWNVPAVCTAVGEKNPDLVRDFQITFEDTRSSVEFNMAQRYAIMKRVVPGMHVTGTAELMGLLPAYVEALNVALDEARMSPHVSSAEGLNTRRRLGNSSYSSFAASDIGRARRRADESGDRNRSRGRGLFDADRYY